MEIKPLNSPDILRSPELLSRRESVLLVVDAQEKLAPVVEGGAAVVWRIARLIQAANALDVPVVVTEQYPRGLGRTVAPIAAALAAAKAHSPPLEKTAFSCCGAEGLLDRLAELDRRQILVVGLEAHVCVLQTAFDLLAAGYAAYVAADAVGSRRGLDKSIALLRMESGGVTLVTAESAMFEWLETAAATEFKALSQLAKEPPPE